MKYLTTSLLTLISFSLWASGKPGDVLKELEGLKQQISNRQGYPKIEALNDDDDDDYPFGYTNVDNTPLPFSGINAPPPDICTEPLTEDFLSGPWPVPQSGISTLEDEIERLKAMDLDALKKKPPQSDWEKLQEAAQSTLRPASNSTPEPLGLNVFVGIESAMVKPSLPPLPLKRRPSRKKKETINKRDKYKKRMMPNHSVLRKEETLARLNRERNQLNNSLIEAKDKRDQSKDEKEIDNLDTLIKRIEGLIQSKIEEEKRESKKVTLESYFVQYVRKPQISSPTPQLSRLGQIYIVPENDQTLLEDTKNILTELTQVNHLSHGDSDTDVDSPPVARRPQSDRN